MSDSFASVRKLFKGGSVLFLGLVLELGISFLAKLLIARELGRVNYGAVSLGIITAAIASTLVLLGLKSGIGRYLPRYDSEAERRGVFVSAFQLSIPIAVLVGLGIFLAAPLFAEVFGDPVLVSVFRIFGIAVPFGAVMKLSLGGIQGLQLSMPRVAVQNVTFPVARFAGIAVALLAGAAVVGVSLAFLFSYVAAAVVGIYYLVTRTPLFDRSISYEPKHRELLQFSLPLVVTAAMHIIFSDIDMYMLGYLVGPGVVGDYNVAYPMGKLLTTALGAFGFIFMPVVSELDAAGDAAQLRRLFQVVTKWIVVGTLPLFLVLVAFPSWAIRLTFGPEYLGAAATLSVLSVGFFLHTVFGLNKGALTSLGHTRLIMYDDVVAAVANVLLNLYLIPRFGLLGAAYATTISYVLLNGLQSTQLYWLTGVQPFTTAMFRPLVIGGVAMGVIYAFARTYLVITPLALVGLFVLFGVVYGIGVLRFGIEPEEVRLVLSVEERFGVDLGPLKDVAKRFM